MAKVKSVLVDLTRCIGCRGCQIACKAWNERPAERTAIRTGYTNPPVLNSNTFTRISFVEEATAKGPVWTFVKSQCMHCKEPACASACPVGALYKTESGAVTYDFDKCIGCRYCMVACPFQIPKYEWESNLPWVRKCTFCSERQADGLLPSCIKTCPTGVMTFGDQKEIEAEAKKRVAEGRGKYVNHIYGMEEAGGCQWLYISDVPFEKLGFTMNVPKQSLPDLTWASLSKVPASVAGFVAALSAIAIFRNRGSKED